MQLETTFSELYLALERHSERIRKPRSTVLFRRGEKSAGIFVVYSGAVVLDFGVDGSCPFSNKCSRGALLGLPATLVRGDYSMTATVSDDAELGFLPIDDFLNLLHDHPELYKHLLGILSEKLTEARNLLKASSPAHQRAA